MKETELIQKLQGLKQIKPSKRWVSLTKNQIFGDNSKFTFFPYFKPAFAGLIAVFILFGAFGFAQNSLPGDLLYPIKKMTERGRAFFVSETEKPAFQMRLANEKLENLTKAPLKNLAPTIFEFEANISEAAKNLAKIDATTSDAIAMGKIIEEAKRLGENKEKIEALGIIISDENTGKLYRATAEYLIKYLESRSLDEEKENILKEMKELYKNEEYSEVLEVFLINQ